MVINTLYTLIHINTILFVYQNNKESMKKAEKTIIDLRQKFPEKKILVLNLVNPRTKPNLNLYLGSMYKYDMEYDPLTERYSNNYIFRGTPENEIASGVVYLLTKLKMQGYKELQTF